MIISKLEGGLGNQLFEYSAGRLLAIRNNTKLKLDISDYSPRYYRKYCLNKLNISAQIANDREIKKHHRYPYLVEKCALVFFKKNFNLGFSNKNVYRERILFKYDKGFLRQSNGTYILGFWQNEKYLAPIRKILLVDFRLKTEEKLFEMEITKKIVHQNSVSIHIRGGDYLDNKKYYSSCDLNYYKRAIRYLSNKFSNLRFYIFSDDSNYVKSSFNFANKMVYISDYKLKDYEELILMSKCKHNIIANSSFSWWGAWLNQNKNKTVISPKKWFNDDSINSTDIIPNQWIKM